MRASSPKVLVSFAVLAIVAAGLAFVCARGLTFPDAASLAPASLQEPAWPTPKPLSAPQAAGIEAPRPADQPLSIAPPAPPMPDQARPAAGPAGQIIDGFLGPARPDGGRPAEIPQITPDQAAAAARTATDFINGALANNGQRRIGGPAQIDPDDAAAMAQSAAKMLNGFLGDSRLADDGFKTGDDRQRKRAR